MAFERLTNLAVAIREEQPRVKAIFSADFQTKAQWLSFIRTNFKDPPEVRKLGTLWQDASVEQCITGFQALFIACWIYFPFEKGSFLLRLDKDVLAVASESLGRLPTRISSHLSGGGFSAHEGFNFLKGYKELLVQREEGGLFLKAEGSPMSGVISTIAHGAGYVKKAFTGTGETASAELQALANSDVEHRIFVPRAAENYSTKYETLLKEMKLTGKTITVLMASIAMFKMCHAKAIKHNCLQQWRALVQQKGFPPDQGIDFYLQFSPSELVNERIADLLCNVVIPFAKNHLPDKSSFKKAVGGANNDILSIAKYLRQDYQQGGSRIFEEVRVTQDTIEVGLQLFEGILSEPPIIS